jgi:hypothetical protein
MAPETCRANDEGNKEYSVHLVGPELNICYQDVRNHKHQIQSYITPSTTHSCICTCTSHYPYCSPTIVRVIKSRRMGKAGHVARMGEGRGVHRVLVGKPEGKRPLGRPRRRWEDNIKMDEHSGSIKCVEFLTGCKPVSFSRRTVLCGVSE